MRYLSIDRIYLPVLDSLCTIYSYLRARNSLWSEKVGAWNCPCNRVSCVAQLHILTQNRGPVPRRTCIRFVCYTPLTCASCAVFLTSCVKQEKRTERQVSEASVRISSWRRIGVIQVALVGSSTSQSFRMWIEDAATRSRRCRPVRFAAWCLPQTWHGVISTKWLRDAGLEPATPRFEVWYAIHCASRAQMPKIAIPRYNTTYKHTHTYIHKPYTLPAPN